MDRQSLRHPVLWDRGNRNHRNYGVASWPAAFLIGADGKVFWQGNPARIPLRPQDAADFRLLLERQLKMAAKSNKE